MMKFSFHVVLVRPLYETNIGACSRAIANMGGNSLFVIAPQCEIGYPAQQAAATSQTALNQRKTYMSLQDMQKSEPHGIYIMLTGKDGESRQVWDLKMALNYIKTDWPESKKASAQNWPIYFVFGPENHGLANEELDCGHLLATLPVYGDNFSLNLSQAVMLTLFIARDFFGGHRVALEGGQPARPAAQPLQNIDQTLKELMLELGFAIEGRRISAHSVLRRMLLTHIPTTKELSILNVVFAQILRKLKEYNILRKAKN